MNTVFENSNSKGSAQISCITYKNLHNISHYHSDYELIHVQAGCAEIFVNEHLFKVNEGQSIFVHSNGIHHIRGNNDAVITVLKADKKLLDGIFSRRTLASPLIEEGCELAAFLDGITTELKQGDENSDMMVSSMTRLFFIQLLRRSPTTEKRSDTTRRMITHEIYRELCSKIATEYATITFESAAKHMNFSEPHFSKVFHNIFGMTFTQYLNTVRIAAALEKLKQGSMSVTEIAGSCGFNTIRNFNRVFKKYTGYSPCNIPSDYVFLYSLQDGYGLDPTLTCTVILEA